MIKYYIILFYAFIIIPPVTAEEIQGDKLDFATYIFNHSFQHILKFMQRKNNIKIILQPQFGNTLTDITGFKFEITIDLP